MRAVTFDPASDQFTVRDLPVPTPEPGDVLVRVEACGVNPVDAKVDQWKDAAPGMSPDWVCGLDVSGSIEAVGAEVSEWAVGDRVLYHGDMFRPHGGFAEFAIHRAETLVPHPDLEAAAAASTPCTCWTAWRAIVDKLRVDRGRSVFVIGAGGVGRFAIQIARLRGADPVVVSCGASGADEARALGATHVVDRKAPDVAGAARAATGGAGFDRALDTVGRDQDLVAAAALGFEGEMLELVDVVRPESYPGAFMNGLSFHQLSLGSGHRNGAAGRAVLAEAGRAASAAIEAGELRLPSFRTITLEDLPGVLLAIRRRERVGKCVLEL